MPDNECVKYRSADPHGVSDYEEKRQSEVVRDQLAAIVMLKQAIDAFAEKLRMIEFPVDWPTEDWSYEDVMGTLKEWIPTQTLAEIEELAWDKVWGEE